MKITPGMWVKYNDDVGITVDVGNPLHVMLHIVSSDGETLYQIKVPIQHLQEAAPDDIPVSRRPKPEPPRKPTRKERLCRFWSRLREKI
jgi:hypothetical protein